jgi:amino acid permease
VINVLGAITSNCISFIFPSLFYFSLVYKKKKEKTHYFHLAWGKFVFFVPAGAFAVVSQFIE